MKRGEHTCLITDVPVTGPCAECEREKAEYEAECAKAEADQAQEAKERHANDDLMWGGYPLTWGDEG